MFCHEVSKVFCCPGRRAAVFSWYHHHCWSGGHIAYSTGHIVIMSALNNMLILCSINAVGIPIGSFSLSSPVCKSTAVFWVCRHAQVIGTSSLLVVWTPSSDTRVDHFGASYLWTGTLTPSRVDGSPTAWTRRAGRSRWSSGSSLSISSRSPIPPGKTVPSSQHLDKHAVAVVLGDPQARNTLRN
jgi:hypothetical protein